MNQVYFYIALPEPIAYGMQCLNPFMNQVYFYRSGTRHDRERTKTCLNPFMNQVYFYTQKQLI